MDVLEDNSSDLWNEPVSSNGLKLGRSRFRFRLNILFLLAMPTMFALGWFVRGVQYEHSVQESARKVVEQYQGTYVPELGLIIGGNSTQYTKRKAEIENQTLCEVERRRTFFESLQADRQKLEESRDTIDSQ